MTIYQRIEAQAAPRGRFLDLTGMSELPEPWRAALTGPPGDLLDPQVLAGEHFDWVLADSTLGQVERYAPYRQSEYLGRLASLGDQLILIGTEPWPVPLHPREKALAALLALRDASFLLAGLRPPREFPLDWVVARLDEVGLRTRHSERLAARVNVAHEETLIRENLARLPAGEMREQLSRQMASRSQRARAAGDLDWGAEYWLVAGRTASIGES